MMKHTLFLFFLLQSLFCFGSENYRFRVYLNDKGKTTYSINEPEEFLSEDALERRKKYNIKIDESDIPISQSYIDTLIQRGYKPIVQSKWFKTVVVEASDSLFIDNLKEWNVVDSVKFVWKGNSEEPEDKLSLFDESPYFISDSKPLTNRYGYAESQVKINNIDKIHKQGFKGKDIKVAVLDAGFKNVDKISAFDSTKIVDAYNIIHPDSSVYDEDDHGLKVLSCLAANVPGVIVGTAPEASYYLIKCEDTDSEFPIEEDYWVRAAEYADSVGVDLITSSLGYFEYDNNSLSPSIQQLDGKSLLISRGATKATEKGIMVFCSAGNEGGGDWRQITFPSDAKEVYTVGAIDNDKNRSNFSSFGFVSKDESVKPDGVALGSGCAVVDSDGNKSYANGTSFATPILAGGAICLVQAFPHLSNKELISLLHKSSSKYHNPTPDVGYGIPDIYKAYKKELKNVNRKRKRDQS